jgi:hypothetical protein
MDDVTPEPRSCEVCGAPIRRDNKYGICVNGTKPECLAARKRKKPKQASRSSGESSRSCEVCGRPINRNNQSGICGRPDSPECLKERGRRTREGFAADLDRPAITAGEVFGNWTTLETCGAQKHAVLCRCACGVVRHVRGEKLIAGLSRSCGCASSAAMVRARFSRPYIPAGAVFGRLTVLEDVPRSLGRAMCRCECETRKDVNAIGLKSGSIESCGCLGQQRRSTLNGFSKHPLYATWNGILDRCNDPKHPSYASYGGRGIAVCERWRDPWLFAEDIEREIGPRPEGRHSNGWPLYSLDRWPDNDGNYEPGNVRWGTQSEQALNQRKVSAMTLELVAAAAKLAELGTIAKERDALAAELAELKSRMSD